MDEILKAKVDEAELAGDDMRTCIKCGGRFPDTSDFFFMDSKSGPCKECTRKQNELSLKLNGKQGKLLKKIAKGQILETSGTEHLYDEILEVFGGPRSFAAQLKLDFDAAKPGSHARVSIMRMVMNLASEADKARRGGRLDDLIEPEDLLRLVQEQMNVQPLAPPEDDNG